MCSHTCLKEKYLRSGFILFSILPLFLLSGLFVIPTQSATAANVTVVWDPNTEADLAGYRIYYGYAKGTYINQIDVGNQTRYTLQNMDDAKVHYIAATAYDTRGNESHYSNELVCNTLVSSAGANGSVSPAGATMVSQGTDKTFIFSPDPGYRIADVIVDGVSKGSPTSYTFAGVNANHSISVTFEADAAPVSSYTLTATAQSNGTISPSGSVTVDSGAGQSFTITPHTHYHIEDVRVDGKSVGAVSSYQFTDVTANHTIEAIFAVDTYLITATAQGNGSVSPSGPVTVNAGTNRTFTMTPESGYEINDVIVDGKSVGTSALYTFSDIDADHTIRVVFKLKNRPPTADAGPDQTVDEGVTVTLSGSNSSDPDPGDTIVSYSWKLLGNETVELFNTDTAEATFITPDVGPEGRSFTFELTVTDQGGLISTATCIVNVSWVNVPPKANAGADQTVDEGTEVTLSGLGSRDPDDGIVSYSWKEVGNKPVELLDADKAEATFIAPHVGPDGESFTFELTVIDQGGLTSTDTCIVNVSWVNAAPTAHAGSDQSVYEGDEVTLNGSQSKDPDDGIASYLWTQVDGKPVTLSDPTAVRPSFTAPQATEGPESLTFKLTVTDHGGMQSSDVTTVLVKKAGPDLTGTWVIWKRFLKNQELWLQLTFRVHNKGIKAAAGTQLRLYLSTDAVLDASDALFVEAAVPSLSPGQSVDIYKIVKISGYRGYLIGVVNAGNSVTETDDANNIIVVD